MELESSETPEGTGVRPGPQSNIKHGRRSYSEFRSTISGYLVFTSESGLRLGHGP